MQSAALTTPQAAEAAFYQAFAHPDLEEMMAVWDEDEDIVCIHPLGPVLRGQAAVREGWGDIFRHAPAIRFRIERVQAYQEGMLAIHIVREHIEVEGERGSRPPIYATNVYRLTREGWRMVLHHASPSPRAAGSSTPKPQVRLH